MAKDKAASGREGIGTFRLIMRILGTLILIGILTSLIFLCIFADYIKTSIIPSTPLDLNDIALKQSSIVWYQDKSSGEWKELAILSGEEERIWVDRSDIPDYMKKALVAIEDKRFYDHHGVDWIRTAGAFVNMFTGSRSSFGGSTITQQLIKNVTHQDDITVQRKLLEIFQALEFEKEYDKEDILEWYLNVVYFGQGCYGVQTAAQTYFGKDVSELSLAESAAIVGITNLPTKYDPFQNPEYNKERQEDILQQMYLQGYISKKEYKEAVAEELDFVHSASGESESSDNVYSYYVETVVNDVVKDLAEEKGVSEKIAKTLIYNGGYHIYCCIDVDIQSKVDSIYTDMTKLPQPTVATDSQLQSAIVIIDQYTGNIVALSGGTGEKDINFGFNRATDALRPPGSSIKPLAVYGPAVEYGLITPSTWVLDADETKVTLAKAPEGWYPKNSPNQYDGVITIATALQKSKNTVSAQIMDKLTPAASLDFLRNRLNFTSLIDADADYAAMALGQPHHGVTVREMAQAYSALANDGVMYESRTYLKVTNADGTEVILDNEPEVQTAFSSNTARVMTYMLNNAATNGTGSSSRLSNMPVAGKTGTTSANKDRWFCGYTPYYTCAVWTGYDTPETMHFYGNPAVTVWHDVMELIHADLPYKDFNMSYGGSPTNLFGTQEELTEIWEGTEDEPEDPDNPVDPTDPTDPAKPEDPVTPSPTPAA